VELIESARLAGRFSTVFFPLDVYDLGRELSGLGFSIGGPLPLRQPIPMSVIGGQASPFASRGEIAVDFDTNKKIIGATGLPLADLISVYQEVLDVFKRNVGEELDYFEFHEFTMAVRIEFDTNPKKAVADEFESAIVTKNLRNELENQELSITGFRVTDLRFNPQNKEYVEVEVRPNPLSERTLSCAAIVRSPDVIKVIREAAVLPDRLEKAIRASLPTKQ